MNNQNSVQTQGFNMTVPGATSQRRDDVKLLEQGPNVGILYSIIDLGTHFNSHFKKSSHIIRLTFEFPLLMQLFNVNDTEERPTVVSVEHTFQIAERSNLKKFIDGALGRVLQPHEYKNGYNIGEFLGKTMVVNIYNKASKKDPTKIYNQIGQVQGLTEHVRNSYAFNWDMVQRHSDLQGFIIDPQGLCFQTDMFASLPSFIRDKIIASDEAKAYAASGGTFIEQKKFENGKPQQATQPPAGAPAPVQRAALPQQPQAKSNLVKGQDGKQYEWLDTNYDYNAYKTQGYQDDMLVTGGQMKLHVVAAPPMPPAPKPVPPLPTPVAPPVATPLPQQPQHPQSFDADADDVPF